MWTLETPRQDSTRHKSPLPYKRSEAAAGQAAKEARAPKVVGMAGVGVGASTTMAEAADEAAEGRR